MATIREMSQAYVSPETKNITELDSVNTELNLEVKDFTDKENKPFTVNVATIDGEEYRVPDSVLKQLKEHLSVKPNLLTFKVNKTGSGINTTYTVIPLE